MARSKNRKDDMRVCLLIGKERKGNTVERKKEKGISVFARYVFVMYIVKQTKKQRGNRTKNRKKNDGKVEFH